MSPRLMQALAYVALFCLFLVSMAMAPIDAKKNDDAQRKLEAVHFKARLFTKYPDPVVQRYLAEKDKP